MAKKGSWDVKIKRTDRPITVDFAALTDFNDTFQTMKHEFPDSMGEIMKYMAKEVRKKMKSHPYAPEIPGQVYERTGNLANRWGYRKLSRVEWGITNSAWYSQQVLGDEKGRGQTHWFKDRWWKAQEVVAYYVDRSVNDMADLLFTDVQKKLNMR